MNFKICIVINFFFLWLISTAQYIDSVHSKLQKLTEKELFDGSVVLVKNGKAIFHQQFGYSNPVKKIPLNEKDAFKIGSISKTYTAALILKLIEQNKLSLTTTLDEFFPEISNARRITIEMMLRHRSGIHSYTDDESYLEYHTKQTGIAEILKKIYSYAADFEPDEKYSYSNSNYFLLALIAEKMSGKSYCRQVLTLIPKKIRGRTMCCVDDCRNFVVSSFVKNDSMWEQAPQTYMTVAHGAGNMAATSLDVAMFYDYLFGRKKVLKSKYLNQMTSFRDNVGFGLFQIPFYQKKGYGHTGGIDAFRSMAVYFPDDDITMVILSNSQTEMSLNDIAIGILSAYYGIAHEFFIPAKHQPSEEILNACVGEFWSEDISLKIQIFRRGNALYAQADGQSAFRLIAESNERFTFRQAGIVLEFKELVDGHYRGFILEQSGYRFQYVRK